jgi:hypothetical protein
MLINYIKTAYRNILRNKGYAVINIAGLALGLAIFSMAALLAEFHFGFDKFLGQNPGASQTIASR